MRPDPFPEPYHAERSSLYISGFGYLITISRSTVPCTTANFPVTNRALNQILWIFARRVIPAILDLWMCQGAAARISHPPSVAVGGRRKSRRGESARPSEGSDVRGHHGPMNRNVQDRLQPYVCPKRTCVVASNLCAGKIERCYDLWVSSHSLASH